MSDSSGFNRLYTVPLEGGLPSLIDTGSFDPFGASMDSTAGNFVFSSIGMTYQLFTIATGGSATVLTSPAYDSLWGSFNPSGSLIVYTSNQSVIPQIYVMNANGSMPIQLTARGDGAVQGRFSPDGSKIVFVSGSASDDIYVMNASGTGQASVLGTPVDENQPCYSPGGAKIAFVRDADGGPNFNGQIWVMNANGTSPVRLTTTMQDDQEPCFSADGASIYFTRTTSTGRAIYRVPVAGGTVSLVIDDGGWMASPSTGS